MSARTCRRALRPSMVAQRLDQIALAHLRAALDADLGRALGQVLLRPVLVGAGLPALLGGRAAARVGDPSRLLLALALLAQGLVLFRVLHARAVTLLRHLARPFVARGWVTRRSSTSTRTTSAASRSASPRSASWSRCCARPSVRTLSRSSSRRCTSVSRSRGPISACSSCCAGYPAGGGCRASRMARR